MLCGIFELGVIAEMKLDEIALADPDEHARNLASERPEQIVHPIRQAPHHLAHFDIHDHLGRYAFAEWARARWEACVRTATSPMISGSIPLAVGPGSVTVEVAGGASAE